MGFVMKKLVVFAAIASFAPSAAAASPVFLKCVLNTHDGERHYDVQLNEDAGTYSFFSHLRKQARKGAAIFTPEHVFFADFEIDRRELTLSYDNTKSAFWGMVDGQAPVDFGKCEIDVEERAF